MLMYRVDAVKGEVVAVECVEPSYPNLDADGKRIFENTHFARADVAWECLQDEVDAWVRNHAAVVADLQKRLEAEKELLVQRTLVACDVRAARIARDAEDDDGSDS